MIESTAGMTLPILMAYLNELLPTLSVDLSITDNKSAHDHDSDESNRLLWIMESKADLAILKNYHVALDARDGELKAYRIASLAKQTTFERYQLACFWLPTLEEEALHPYIPVLMRYRDLYAAHLIVAVNKSIDLRNYGLIPFTIIEDNVASSSIKLWQFNLYDYKQLPNWLNSDHWANPENWNKRRW